MTEMHAVTKSSTTQRLVVDASRDRDPDANPRVDAEVVTLTLTLTLE